MFTYEGDNSSLKGFLDAIQIVMETGFVVTAFMTMILNLVLPDDEDDEADALDATEGSLQREESTVVGQAESKEP